MLRKFPWKAVIAGAAAVGVGLLALKTYNEKHRRPAPKRVALIGDSYAVGLGWELAKIYPDFKWEGHVGTTTQNWARHTGCGTCGDWLTEYKPDLVLVALGVNDGANPNPANYQTIVKGLHEIGARVVWIEPPLRRMTNALYNAIHSLGVEVVPPTHTPLSSDGLHPTAAGYQAWASEIAEAVSRG